jgi:K+-sensing histidine kinase KdpD
MHEEAESRDSATQFFDNLAGFLPHRTRAFLLVTSLLLILLIGLVDYATGYEVSLSIFYLLPIGLTTWFVKKAYGVASAVLSAVVWLLAELALHHPYSALLIPYWNALVRLGFFLIVVAILSRLERAFGEQRRLIGELRAAIDKVNTLSGLLPICASCKKIRDDQGYWNQLEAYLQEHSGIEFSHGICPECARKLYPELYEDQDVKREE